jgi:uncharacterized repeat protein (TIGR03847 family)
MAHYDDDEALPVTRITAGAVGQPGSRIFILQAHYGEQVVSWVVEKAQVVSLSRALPHLLVTVQEEYPELDAPLTASEPHLALREPLMPDFRVGSIALDYDRYHDLVVITLIDAVNEEFDGLEDMDDTPVEGAELPVYTTRGQALLLARQAEMVVSAGRPLCPTCGEPIDDFGHFCLPASSRSARGGVLLH